MKRALVVGTLLLASFGCRGTDIASLAWRADEQAAMNAAADLPAQAQRLLETLLPDADVVEPAVGEARFVDLDADGTLALVATVDDSGRGFFNHVVVVRQRRGGFTWTSVRNDGLSIEHLPAHLVDADGDGVPELILEKFMDRYEGALRVPLETVVYRWGAEGFRDASDAFPQYYRARVVPRLEKQLAEALSSASASTPAPAHRDDDIAVLQAELARARYRARSK